MNLESICDLIVLIGAAYFTIIKIINSFAKPSSKLKKRQEEKDKEKIKKALDEIMPKYFEEHDLKIKDKFIEDKDKYISEVEMEVIKNIKKDLEDIKRINENQEKRLDELSQKIYLINDSSKDMMRQKIMNIYYKNVKNKEISISDKEALEELYKDYKKQSGNGYIDKYYNRMSSWKIIDENDLYDEI